MAIPFSPPPSGRMALVYADVEGGARLLERIPHEVQAALRLYDQLLRRALAETGGHELRAYGHAFLAAWQRPSSALDWCERVQGGLLELNWSFELLEQPEAAVVRASGSDEVILRGLRVRMGMHVGAPRVRSDGRERRSKYFGPAVTHTARVAGAAQGGQVLLSEAAWREVEAELPGHLVSRQLGAFRLRGQRGAHELVQVLPRALAERSFGPPRTLDAWRTNIEVEPAPLIGREADLAAVGELFTMGVRLVTVVGAPGIGKSRLCAEYASSRASSLEGGAWASDLSRARTPDIMLRAVAAALEVPVTLARTVDEGVRQLGHAISGRGDVLLLLDEWESGAPFLGPTLETWMRRAGRARFLVAADAPLGIAGEVVYRLGPLLLPDEGPGGAVALFEEVTRSVRPSFRLVSADLDVVYEILRITGGVPFAIELVAARMSVLSLQELLRGLLVRSGPRPYGVAVSPEEGLRVALEWAWDQLSFWERDAVAQCALFRRGFALEAAEAVLDLSEHPSAPWIGDVLEALVERRLVRLGTRPEAPGVRRFRLHKSLGRFASRRLGQILRDAAAARHADHYLSLAEMWGRDAYRSGGAEALAWLELELENLLAVHRRALEGRPVLRVQVERALRIAVALEPLLALWGPLQTHLELLDPALAAVALLPDVDPIQRVRALRARARASGLRGSVEQAGADLEEARFLARSAGDRRGEALCLAGFGRLSALQRRADEALESWTEAAAIFVELGDERGEGRVRFELGALLLDEGELDQASALLEAAADLLRRAGDRRGEGRCVGALGALHGHQGDAERAARLYREAIRIHANTGGRTQEGRMLGAIGALHYERGELDQAEACHRRALTLAREVGARANEAAAHVDLGLVLLERDQHHESQEQLLAGLSVCRDLGDRRGQARALGRLGLLLQIQGRIDAARGSYEQAEQLVEHLRDRRLRARILAWHGAFEAEQGELSSAGRLLGLAAEAGRDFEHTELRVLHEVLALTCDLVAGAADTRAAVRIRLDAVAPTGEVRLAVELVRRMLAAGAPAQRTVG